MINQSSTHQRESALRFGERGASLISLMALMTIITIFLLAAAPVFQQQSQRQKEDEAIFRGQEVAEAIRLYIRFNRRWPTSIDELLEGANVPGRTTKLQILRRSSARDPLSKSGEWKLVKPRSQELIRFARDITEYNNGVLPTTTSPDQLVIQETQFVVNTRETDEEEDLAPGGEDDSDNFTGPFIGVTSRSRRKSVVTYYGISRHDRWLFTPLFR
jgi:type II secretory pathway pseudopilin PulG